MPDLSIVLVTRNSAAVVGRTLESIFAQKYASWECIVVDDGSTDETPAIVERLVSSDARFLMVRQKFGGTSVARNRGFMESKPTSAYVCFVDAGDAWDPDALMLLVSCLERNPTAVGAHGLVAFTDQEDGPLPFTDLGKHARRRVGYEEGAIVEWPCSKPTGFENLLWTDLLSPSGVFLARRTACERVGLYDPRLGECSQWDMSLRLARLGVIEFLDQVLLYQSCEKNGSGAVGGSTVRRLQRKTFLSPENSEKHRELILRGWRAWQWLKIRESCQRIVGTFLGRASIRELRALGNLPFHALDYIFGRPFQM